MCSLALSEEDDQSPEGGVDSQGGQEHGHEVDGVEHRHEDALLDLHAEGAQDVAGVVDSLGEGGEGHLFAVVDVREALGAAGHEVRREQVDGGVVVGAGPLRGRGGRGEICGCDVTGSCCWWRGS